MAFPFRPPSPFARTAATVWAALLVFGCAGPPEPAAPRPGGEAGLAAGQAMVAAANPLAAEAGMAVLRRGGSAVDAAVAVQAVLGLVEPQSSGLGGGAFVTHYDARTRRVVVYDGRETAPAGARPDMFLDAEGRPLPFPEAVGSGRSTGVPGAVAALALAHRGRGRLLWRTLFDDAARLAEDGFVVSPRLAGFAGGTGAFAARPDVAAYFAAPGGGRIGAGERLRNPDYARTLRRIAAEGPKALYEGEIARAVAARAGAEPLPGALSAADMAAYRPVEREALCRPYRIYVVCVPPPPSSGVGLLQALMILERTDFAGRGPDDPRAWLLFAEASRLMYADRDAYVADPAFVQVPVEGLLDPAYVAGRAALIGAAAASVPPAAGLPPGAPAPGRDATREAAGTSHFVVVDAFGDVVSVTTTVESVFGSGRMAAGFFLNNQLTDFAFRPVDAEGRPVANAVAPGKRPRSSMSPVIVTDRDGRFVAALGSPGGNSILAYNLKALVAVLDWGLTPQEAAALPNLIARGATFGAEVDRMPPGLVDRLKALGVDLRPGQGEGSGLHLVVARDGRLVGGADPRREGVVLSR